MYKVSNVRTLFLFLLGASKPLSTLIEGESLMNDGSAIVLFLIMLDICKGTAEVAGETVAG